MTSHFQRLREGIVADATQAVSENPRLADAERHQLLVEWNDTRIDYPSDKCIHELFETQAASTPDASAVVFAGPTHGEFDISSDSEQMRSKFYNREVAL